MERSYAKSNIHGQNWPNLLVDKIILNKMVFYVCFTYTNVIVRDIKERLHIKIIITKRVILWVEFMKIGGRVEN